MNEIPIGSPRLQFFCPPKHTNLNITSFIPKHSCSCIQHLPAWLFKIRRPLVVFLGRACCHKKLLQQDSSRTWKIPRLHLETQTAMYQQLFIPSQLAPLLSSLLNGSHVGPGSTMPFAGLPTTSPLRLHCLTTCGCKASALGTFEYRDIGSGRCTSGLTAQKQTECRLLRTQTRSQTAFGKQPD